MHLRSVSSEVSHISYLVLIMSYEVAIIIILLFSCFISEDVEVQKVGRAVLDPFALPACVFLLCSRLAPAGSTLPSVQTGSGFSQGLSHLAPALCSLFLLAARSSKELSQLSSLFSPPVSSKTTEIWSLLPRFHWHLL